MTLFIISISFFTIMYVTNFASSESINFFSIFLCKLVTTWAVTFAVYFPSSNIVFFLRNSLKMFWIYARSIHTQMINMISFWNMTIMNFIRISMGPFWFSSRDHKFTVSVIFSSNPFPAIFCFYNFCEESISNGFHWNHINQLMGQVKCG